MAKHKHNFQPPDGDEYGVDFDDPSIIIWKCDVDGCSQTREFDPMLPPINVVNYRKRIWRAIEWYEGRV